jgi:molybdate transport system substrate-binding protein
MRLRTLFAAGFAASALVLTSACGSGAPHTSDAADGSDSGGDTATTTLTVYAAASLQSSFDEIAEEFTAANPDITVAPISYDGSSTLATQITEGAPVDVFASADEANMTTVTDAGLASDPQAFATNTLVVAVPAGNPADVKTLADLADVKTVLCAPKVPCGNASQTLLSDAGVDVTPVSEEQNVTSVLQKVSAGEADAGLVYATDVQGDDTVESFVPDGADEVVNTYPIVALDDAPNPEAAAAFVEFVNGPEGQAILKEHGFGAP